MLLQATYMAVCVAEQNPDTHDKDAESGVEYVYSVAPVNDQGTEGPSASVTVVAR